jgi:NAD(P)-dependent dehydrogenase (short-subunit alcohol dehydrogenase family)
MQNIVITGGTKGIGRGLATEFAQRGHNVLICGRAQPSIDEALDQVGKLRGSLVGQVCDVGDRQQLQSLWDRATEEFGSVDIWVNNAGLARTTWPIVDTPPEQIDAMLQTNMPGTIFGSIVAAQGMSAQGNGKIFNILGGGSDGEYFPGIAIYGTTKRGLDYFSTALAKELRGSGVIVGRVRPGMIVTGAVVREAKQDLDNFRKSRKMINNLVDQVETVSPFLVDAMLAFEKSGAKIRWLTGGKIAWRMLKARFRTRADQFERFGL